SVDLKLHTLPLTAVAGLIAAIGFATWAPGQGSAAARGTPPQSGTNIALVDLSQVYQNYAKLEDLRSGWKIEAEQAQAKAKGFIDKAKAIQDELKSGEFETDSPEYLEREKKMIQLSTRFETYKALATKDLKKKDAQILLAVHQDVQKALAL